MVRRCVDIDEFELCDDDEVRLDGVFSTQDLRTIVDALEALPTPDAWEAAPREEATELTNAFMTKDTLSSTQALARSLFYEALQSSPPRPPPAPRLAEPPPATDYAATHRRGRTRYWNCARILEALQAFLARDGRLPTASEWRQAAVLGLPTRQTVIQRFGTMDAVRRQLAARATVLERDT